ncbi:MULTISPECIES: phage tail protein [Arsenophonus]|jgi:phage-related protein|uniref:phage tail protein n=1 Tax=Arsenophonus TaxID=637 RepID=UPI001CDBB3C3|nr:MULTISPECIES: phage tail protein [Arsenophonus]UBX30330.1 phage tail protein [Arsenophonus apicola]
MANTNSTSTGGRIFTSDQKVEFGDGYSQVAAGGINPETQAGSFLYLGNKAQVTPIF